MQAARPRRPRSRLRAMARRRPVRRLRRRCRRRHGLTDSRTLGLGRTRIDASCSVNARQGRRGQALAAGVADCCGFRTTTGQSPVGRAASVAPAVGRTDRDSVAAKAPRANQCGGVQSAPAFGSGTVARLPAAPAPGSGPVRQTYDRSGGEVPPGRGQGAPCTRQPGGPTPLLRGPRHRRAVPYSYIRLQVPPSAITSPISFDDINTQTAQHGAAIGF